MPSLPPGYLYTFAAVLAVSSLLVLSFMAYANTVRFSSEAKQLKNLIDRLAYQSAKLVTFTLSGNTTATDYVQLPTRLGDRQYWLRLRNDSQTAWAEGGFGNVVVEDTDLRVYLPRDVAAAGYYVSDHGAARLTCTSSGEVLQLQLGDSSEV